jgi:putative membrane protein
MNKTTVLTLLAGLAFGLATQAAVPTDAEIAHIVVTANSIDVEGGNLAKIKAKDGEVKKYGQMMVTDHSSANRQATDLTKKLGLTPKPNDTSTMLRKDANAHVAELKGLEGKDFDREYLNNEVNFHQAVLDMIDQTLIPNAKNEELKALIMKVRPNIAGHLEHAKHLQSSLSGS